MRTASVRQIRLAFPALLRAVKDGESIAITSRRKVVATLCPPPSVPVSAKPWSELAERILAQPARPSLDIASMLSEDRDDLR